VETAKKHRTRLILISLIVISSFVTGFTYHDLGNGGVNAALFGMRLIPSTVLSAAIGVKDQPAALQPVETYWNVINYLDSHYYGKGTEYRKLTYAAIRGMLAALGDRYTRFLDPDERKDMNQETRGDFEGIGAELEETTDGRIFIKKILDNSPAQRAELKAKDTIIKVDDKLNKVDDKLIHGIKIEDVVKMIRGPRGTKVTLTIVREEKPEPFDVEIIRDVVPIIVVESRMEDTVNKIGYIALGQFNEKSDRKVSDAMNELDSEGARALILDLRGNPGGLLESAISIGSRFILDGDIVVIQNKGGRRSAVPVDTSKHTHTLRPLVVLIDHNTASASEIVAGAIQDHKAGVLIGSESFGKGLVQSIAPLDEYGCALAITTARYLTPNGHDVTPKEKIKPDIAVEPTDEDIKAESDVQLKRAVEYLKERLGAAQTTAENRPAGKG